jgi:hypothetical protein
MEQMVDFPTRARDNHTLDLITTLPGQIREVYSPDQLSDHEIVSCHLIIRTKHVKTIKRKCYLYNKGDYDKMRDDTKIFSKEKYFNGQQNTRNNEDNWKMIKTFMQQAVEKHVPSKICKGKRSLSWITQSIRRMIRKCNKLHKRAKETGSGRLKKKWKQLRSGIKSEITSSHNKYVENMIGNIKENSKPFWKYISSKRKDTQSIPPLDTKHGTTAESDVDKAEALNDQFTGVFTKKTHNQVPLLERKIPKNEGYTNHRRRRFKITSRFKYIESTWSR